MAEKGEVSAAVERYKQNKYLMIRESQRFLDFIQPGKTATRDVADAINRACSHYGYLSGATASIIGRRDLTVYEKKNLVPTVKKAAYFACFFAMYGGESWAETPEAALYQVYSYCLCGTPAPPPDADPDTLKRLNALPRTIELDRIRPLSAEPIEQQQEIAAYLRVATPGALAEYLRAIAENLEELAIQPVDEDEEFEVEPPCDENCVMVSYLRLGGKAGHPVTDDDREQAASATGIPLPRIVRLVCGDLWTPAEEAAIDDYVGVPGFTLAGLAALAAAAKANANNKPHP